MFILHFNKYLLLQINNVIALIWNFPIAATNITEYILMKVANVIGIAFIQLPNNFTL